MGAARERVGRKFPNYAVWSDAIKRDIVQSPNRVKVNNYFSEWTNERDSEHIAHNDPETIALVADVLAVARHVSNYWHEEGRVDMPMRDLDKALAALDEHTNKVTP